MRRSHNLRWTGDANSIKGFLETKTLIEMIKRQKHTVHGRLETETQFMMVCRQENN
jgi:hypothetical protein